VVDWGRQIHPFFPLIRASIHCISPSTNGIRNEICVRVGHLFNLEFHLFFAFWYRFEIQDLRTRIDQNNFPSRLSCPLQSLLLLSNQISRSSWAGTSIGIFLLWYTYPEISIKFSNSQYSLHLAFLSFEPCEFHFLESFFQGYVDH